MDKYLTDKNFFREPSTLRKCYINNFDALDTYWKKYLTYLNKLECFTKRYVVFQKEADNLKKKLLSNSCDVSIVLNQYLFIINYLNEYLFFSSH